MSPTMRMGGEKSVSAGEGATGDAEKAVSQRPLQARRCPTCQKPFSGDARFCPFDGDPLVDAPDWNPAADPMIGQTIEGRYHVEGVLGEGGMGTVYEVRHVTLGRRFAMKVLRRGVTHDAELTARFIQEAKIAAGIGHPHIVAVTDFGDIDVDRGGVTAKAPFFVMEYLTGESLAALLKRERILDPRRAAQILIQSVSALFAAHQAGVIHRDLKPDNIFITDVAGSEFVKILDFGVAKLAGAGRLTTAGMVYGTPYYMSPEQAAGRVCDARADVYSLGVIMYECFAGRVPFEAETYMGVLTQHIFAVPIPLDRVAPNPEGLGALGPIAMRCLDKDPDARYATMEDVGRAIEEALAGVPESAGTGRGSSRSPKLRLREPNASPSLRPNELLEIPGIGGSPWRVPAAIGLVTLAIAGFALWRSSVRPSPSSVRASLVAEAPAAAALPLPSSESSAPPPAATAAPTSSPAATSSAMTSPAVVQVPVPARTGVLARPRGTPKPAKRKGEVIDPWGD